MPNNPYALDCIDVAFNELVLSHNLDICQVVNDTSKSITFVDLNPGMCAIKFGNTELIVNYDKDSLIPLQVITMLSGEFDNLETFKNEFALYNYVNSELKNYCDRVHCLANKGQKSYEDFVKVINYYLDCMEDDSVNARLQTFENYPLIVLSITYINGSEVLHINLRDDNVIKPYITWVSGPKHIVKFFEDLNETYEWINKFIDNRCKFVFNN